jgi:hypothetical protein
MLEDADGVLTSEQVADILGAFQFGNEKTITGLEEVLAEFKDLDPWMQMVFFTSPHERLE